MKVAVITLLACVCLDVHQGLSLSSKYRTVGPVTAEKEARKLQPPRDERALHCHNTIRTGLKCHRGYTYQGPR